MSTRFSSPLSILNALCVVAVLGFGAAEVQADKVPMGCVLRPKPAGDLMQVKCGEPVPNLAPGMYEVSQPGKAPVTLKVEKGMALVIPADGKAPIVQRVNPISYGR